MDLAIMLKHLFSSIVSVMEAFRFTVGGVTVSYLQFFCWFLLASFLIKIFLDFLGGQ